MDAMSAKQFEALQTVRIDIGFGRVRRNDASVERTVLREERLVLAVAPGSRLADSDAPVAIADLAGEELIVYPKGQSPSFADQVLAPPEDHGVRPGNVHEVSEMQIALGLAAPATGVYVVPYPASSPRTDLTHRPNNDEHTTLPVNH